MKTVLKLLVLLISVTACKDVSTTIQGFQTKEVDVTETSGLQHIIFDLGTGLNTATTVTILISGTAGMDADFVITNGTEPIDLGNGVTKVPGLETSETSTAYLQYAVLPGQKSITIPVKIIDDNQIEPGYETIQFQLTGFSDSGVGVTNQTTTIFISDADVPKSDEVQVDLSWQLQSGGSINNSNFDLFLVKNVKLGSSFSDSSYELVTGYSLQHLTGFETLLLTDSLPDEKYYLLTRYVSGSSTAKIKLVISQNQDIRSATGQVGGSQVGSAFLFGPIYKSTSGFTYRTQGVDPTWFK